MHEMWIQIVKNIAVKPYDIDELECPICKSKKTIDYLYVGDETTRVGYLMIWCGNCLKGTYVSRVIAPPNAKFITFNDEIKDIVPKYDFDE